MIIIRRRGEVIRFVLFLVVIGVMAYYVASRWETWHLARVPHLPAAESEAESVPGLPVPESPVGSVEADKGEDFFAAFRVTRAQTRSALRETLREIMENPTAAEETRASAEAEYVQLGRYDALEEQAEALVKARGFADAVVHIAGDTAQVVVKAGSLTPQQASQVVDTVSRVTGVKAAGVQVMAREH